MIRYPQYTLGGKPKAGNGGLTMQKGQVEVIIMYYHEIPNMMKLLRRERADLEEEYCGLRGTPADRLPQGSALGNPTAALAEQAEERGVYERLQEIDIKMQVLSADKALIQGCLDALRGKYKKLIFLRCLTGYSWARTAAEIGVPDTTARRQYKRAVIRLGESLEDMPMAEEILARASRARV